ncbi:MAG: hypothetical protein ACRDMX_10435 [Solirubrobacteraceae bacterium]
MSDPRDPALGDELLPEANMVFDRCAIIAASAAEVWPWLVQLGKHRAGWYLPAHLERLLPSDRRASRTLDPRWQTLGVGERVPDYGGSEEYLEVVRIEPARALVYRSERRGARFTWALLLSALSPGETELRLRFRGQLKSSGWQRRAIVAAGDFFDWSTSELMLCGLRERVAHTDRTPFVGPPRVRGWWM